MNTASPVQNLEPVLCRIYRGEILESEHRGSFVVVKGDDLGLHVGNPDRTVIPRSSLKPLQLLPLFSAGTPARLQCDKEERACLCASHSSDEGHIAAVRRILARAEIPESALACGPHAPIDQAAAIRLHRRGEEPGRIHNNCSGKHSGFLIRAQELGAELEGYLDPKHPVQVEVREALCEIASLSLEAEDAVIDGCGAPMYAFPLRKLAGLFRDLANPERLPTRFREGARQIFSAFNDAPHFIAGYRAKGRIRFDTALLEAGRGALFGKCGAEGVFAIGIRADRNRPAMGIAIKASDGNLRAYESVLPAILCRLGIFEGNEEALRPFFDGPIFNTQGLRVGRKEPVLP